MQTPTPEVIKDIMDIYPHIVGRLVKCWCGAKLTKGTDAFMAVLHPNPDGYWLGQKVVCSPDCPMIIKKAEF